MVVTSDEGEIMKKYAKYLWYVIRHKWYVFQVCRKEGFTWRGLIHDWSKFLPSEFIPYAKHFYGKPGGGIKTGRDKTGYYKPTDTGDLAFDFAWLLHQKRNKHHWQWWILPEDEGGVKVLNIPCCYVMEMICDWRGASKAQGHGGDISEWWIANNGKMQLHAATRAFLEHKAAGKVL